MRVNNIDNKHSFNGSVNCPEGIEKIMRDLEYANVGRRQRNKVRKLLTDPQEGFIPIAETLGLDFVICSKNIKPGKWFRQGESRFTIKISNDEENTQRDLFKQTERVIKIINGESNTLHGQYIKDAFNLTYHQIIKPIEDELLAHILARFVKKQP